MAPAPLHSSKKPDLSPLADVVAGCESILIASHNNPDPDAIASAVLLKALLVRKYRRRTVIAYSGVIGRAENAAMLRYSGEKFEALKSVKRGAYDAIALVDTQPGTGNHGFTGADPVRMIFDHHRLRLETRAVPFYDVRTSIGATTTLLYLYWKAARLPVSKKQATLMLYALSSETADMGP